ncbi:MAG: glycosyltransferase family 2 protein [Ferruginibacter sp.]|nr:glycosyltransferase family 2 protein [Ferruginibacter sp.]
MDLSIILVNYKSSQLVLDCIESIYLQTIQYSFEIIVVDNDSKDDCRELLLRNYPKVRFLPLDYNAGFARANNAGIEICGGESILILNTDTIILDGAIDKTITLLKQNPGAVGCGVQLLNVDGTTQISGAHIIRGGLNTLLPLPYLGRLIRWLGYRLKSTIPSVQTISDTIEVDWIVGAYILVKKEVLKRSGLFDNDFFMYSEEIEWCGRLRKYGQLLLFAEPKVLHYGGGTSSDYYNTSENENGKNLWDNKGRQIIVSTMLRIRKQFGVFWYLLIISTYVFEIPVFFFCLWIDKILHAGKSKYTWQNLADYNSNIAVLVKYFFKILFNKPYFYKVA